MWDNHQALDLLANTLFVLVALMVAYTASQRALSLPVLPVKALSVNGSSDGSGKLKHVTREQIESAVHSEYIGSFLTLDLNTMRQAFGKLPWVRVASVRRHWPQSLEVTLEEHVALARWGSDALVNTHGETFNAASDEVLPVFDGPTGSSHDMVRQYAVFTELLRPLQQRIEQMNLSPRRAWRVHLDNGTVLELGREQMESRMARYVLAHDHSIARLNRQLSYVDLRYPNGFAVR
ncbi:cell division protein FtsQ/DivIB [Nitrosospira sp. Nsp13]|uniref:cell division protein FtsQ/DivIB n=1 Tax=Nitrosospira sp. Nsp13 TaxID=1855332 RepID=UPI000886200B|nr:cell division protein FtsQ/DivIB [Nitrosospira sp. Nsp13]SCY26315.1 cell division protein FtsQ [Nitrosospira sp. Nsp13]